LALIVQKYGGTSVGDVERIKNVARRCIATQKAGNDVVVVVSAMSGETNRLLKLVSQITDRPNEREQDVVAATGEQVTIGLVSLAIQAQKKKAVSFMGHQVRITTDSAFSKARIKSIDSDKIRAALKKKNIVVVAGFQDIIVDLIVQNVSKDGRTDLTFTVGKADLTKAKDVVKKIAKTIQIKPQDVETDEQISKVSVVGVGMRNHSGVAAKMFKVLASAGINVQMISTSEIKVSCVIHSNYTELAVRELHTAFGLDRPASEGVAESVPMKG
jgi:aspartate kinase